MHAILPFPDISPDIFSIDIGSFTFAPKWYALAYIAGLVLAWRWIVRMVKTPRLWADGKAPMTPEQPEDLLMWIVFGVILGGRFGFILFYQPSYYFQNPAEILAIWQGGMSFHGGFIGVIIAGLLFCWRNGLSVGSVGDSMAATVPIGLFLGRITNFINGELWGRPSTAAWAVEFPGVRAAECPPDWTAACSRHPSQLYEAGLEGLLLGIVMFFLVYRRGWLKVPGQLIGVFFIGYGLARSFVEFFRQADAQFISDGNPWGYVIQFGYGGFGITMGQLLSLPMILIGIYIIHYARRRLS